MTESESVALPLGDTPISSYQYILADIADYIKHFLYLFQKIFNAGDGIEERRRHRRQGDGSKTGRQRPKTARRNRKQGSARRRKTAPKTRRRFEDGAACRFPSPRRRGSGARRRGGDRFLYLFQKIFNTASCAQRRGSGVRRRGGGCEDRTTAPENRAAMPESGAAIAFYIFFKKFLMRAVPENEEAAHKDGTAGETRRRRPKTNRRRLKAKRRRTKT